MTGRDVLGLGFSNLGRQKVRTLLTCLGVAVGTGAIVLMVSLGVGIQAEATEVFNQVEFLTTIKVFRHKTQNEFGKWGRKAPGAVEKVLNADSVRTLEKIPGVVAAFPDYRNYLPCEFRFPMPIVLPTGRELDRWSGQGEIVGLPERGVTPAMKSLLLQGGFWSGPDAWEIVIPSDVFRWSGIEEEFNLVGSRVTIWLPRDFPREKEKKDTTPAGTPAGEKPPLPAPPPGDGGGKTGEDKTAPDEGPELTLDPKTGESVPLRGKRGIVFTIVGVYDSRQMPTFGWSRAFVPESRARRLAAWRAENAEPPKDFNSLFVKVETPRETEPVRRAIEQQGYGTLTVGDIVQTIGQLFLIIDAVLACIGSVGLLVAFFGITNTLVMAVLERTREIGILKALGARPAEIRRIFLVEAAGIGAIGAAGGLLMGWGMGQLFNLVGNLIVQKAGTFAPRHVELFRVSPLLAGAAAGFTVLVSLAAGLYPAWRAARLDPVAALRHE